MRNSKCVQKVVQSGRRAWLKMRNHRLLAFTVTLANVYRITSDSTQQANRPAAVKHSDCKSRQGRLGMQECNKIYGRVVTATGGVAHAFDVLL